MRFSDSLEQHFEALIARRGGARAALIPMLRAVQKERRYVSDEALREIAQRAGAKEPDVENILGYFGIQRHEPPSRHVLQVCVNAHCRRRGSEGLLEHCKRTLGVELDQPTPDRRLMLQAIVCLRACDVGPAVRVDREILEGVTPERIDAIVRDLREGDEPSPEAAPT